MKADKREESRSRRERRVECMDAMNRHRANAGVVAGLLEYCDAENIDCRLVVSAGMMIREELDEVRVWTRRLEEAIQQWK